MCIRDSSWYSELNSLQNVYFGFFIFGKLTERCCFATFLSNDPRTFNLTFDSIHLPDSTCHICHLDLSAHPVIGCSQPRGSDVRQWSLHPCAQYDHCFPAADHAAAPTHEPTLCWNITHAKHGATSYVGIIAVFSVAALSQLLGVRSTPQWSFGIAAAGFYISCHSTNNIKSTKYKNDYHQFNKSK